MELAASGLGRGDSSWAAVSSHHRAGLSSCSLECRKEEPGGGPLRHWFVVPVTAVVVNSVDLEDLAGKTLARTSSG